MKKENTFEWPFGYVSYETYAGIKKERQEALEAHDWDRYHMLDDAMENCKVIPAVGVPGTVHYYTDSCSGHVERMISPRELVFKETGIYSGTYTFTLRKGGRWVEKGQAVRGGVRLTLGWAHDYYCQEI